MRNFALMVIAFVITAAGSIVVFPLQLVRRAILKLGLSNYFKTIAIGLDQLGGSVLYNQEDWTVSSYTHLLCMRGNAFACRFERFIDAIFGQGHCRRSFENEVRQFRKQAEVQK